VAAAADEFTADTVARISACFVERHWNFPLPQPDAERESGQTAANNRDGIKRRHFIRFAARQIND
jgi:hypothetical protein